MNGLTSTVKAPLLCDVSVSIGKTEKICLINGTGVVDLDSEGIRDFYERKEAQACPDLKQHRWYSKEVLV